MLWFSGGNLKVYTGHPGRQDGGCVVGRQRCHSAPTARLTEVTPARTVPGTACRSAYQGPIPMSVLVLHAPPDLPPSRVDAALAATACGVPGVTVHDLCEADPRFFVDGAREQAPGDVRRALVLQHPMYRYGVPPLLEQSMDTTPVEGRAWGRSANATPGKIRAHSITIAGSALGAAERALRLLGNGAFRARSIVLRFKEHDAALSDRRAGPLRVTSATRPPTRSDRA